MTEARPFKILGINHVGLAPKSPGDTSSLFALLGLGDLGEEAVPSQDTHTAMFTSQTAGQKDTHTGRLEILSPLTPGEGPIGKFLTSRGSGVHHVALSVDNVASAIEFLKAKGVDLIDQVPRPGAHNTRIAFIHPRAAGGLLIELVEELA